MEIKAMGLVAGLEGVKPRWVVGQYVNIKRKGYSKVKSIHYIMPADTESKWDYNTDEEKMAGMIEIITPFAFTTKHDSEGTEIYDGHILKTEDGIMLVGWQERTAGFCLIRKGWLYDHFFDESFDASDCTIIGHKATHPELLKGDQNGSAMDNI